MWIPNPDSPNIMPDSFANARPELRQYMTGRSPFEVREPSYRNTRDELRSKIDSQDTFSRMAGRALEKAEPAPLPKLERIRPTLPKLDLTKPDAAPLPDSYQMIREAEAKIEKCRDRYDFMQAQIGIKQEKKIAHKEFMDTYGVSLDSYTP